MNLLEPFLRDNPKARVAIIDKDTPGGICLTRGCIPTKLLTYPADLVRTVESASRFGLRVNAENPDFAKVMRRMHRHVDPAIDEIRKGLRSSPDVDFYAKPARFVAPYQLEVDGKRITSRFILLCAGSKPHIPQIEGLEETAYHTSDTILGLKRLPRTITIVGGGYIAAEFGHFFSAMGSRVTILGRNEQFLPREEPEVSQLVVEKLGRRLKILTGATVKRVARRGRDRIHVTYERNSQTHSLTTDLFLVATGRASNADVLDPRAGGIEIDKDGWIQVDDYLETAQPGVWALGDALGRHQFKHAANYESWVVYQNAFLGRRVKPDYHAVPHAVFTFPEVAAVGMRQGEAIHRFGAHEILVGLHRYTDTAKGEAMHAEGDFAKVIVQASTRRILGAHIVGPHASILIQEIVNAMNTPDGSVDLITGSMHIHPALAEVVDRACNSLRPVHARGARGQNADSHRRPKRAVPAGPVDL